MKKIFLGILTLITCQLSNAQLTIYSDYNLQGTSGSCFVRTIYTGTNIPNGLNDGIKSISLSQGFMATVAENEDGSGERFTYMATKSNINMNLAMVLQNKVSFIRVLKLPSTTVNKKGSANTDNAITDALNVSWFYDWGFKDYSTATREFAPMCWNGSGASDANISSVIQKDTITHYLAFNEPDNDGQANMYVAAAVPLYKKLLSAGQRMGSPACTESQYRVWLDSFSTVANQQKLDIDVVCVHWYDWGNYTSTLNANPSATDVFNRFKSYIDAVYNLYRKPIWITEFNANVNRPASVHEAFMQLALPWLDADPRIERYAYFFGNDLPAYSSPGVLSNGGTIYANHASVDAYPENIYDTRPAFPITLAAWNPSTFTQGGNTVTNFTATTLNTNMTAPLALTRGSGVVLPDATASNGYWGGTTWSTTTALAGTNANKFLKFSLKSKNGKSVNYHSIDKFNIRINNIGPIQYQIDYQIDNGTFYPCATLSGPTRTTGNYLLGPIDLSDITGLQDVPPTSTVTFRITPFDASGTGTFLIGSGTADTDPDLVITGGFSDANFITQLSSNANLTSLTLGSTTLSPTFATATTAYTASVVNDTSSIAITPTKADATAIIHARVNSGSYVNVTSGSASSALNLNVGSNTIDVRVTAQDASIKTYSIAVTRAQSSNANLSALTISAGTLSPTFATATTAYTASVANGSSTITVTPTKADATATIQARVNSGSYVSVTSGSASSALSLNVGSNTIDILVTAQDATTKTYTITVTRAQSSNANLSALTISAGTLSPTFTAATIAYTASVANGSSTITVTPTRSDVTATIQARVNSGSYVSVTSGSASSALSLNVGSNIIDILVTAQDGTTKTYTITVTRLSANADLSSLALSLGTLSPTFAAATTAYTASVSNGTSTITITPTKADANATIQARVNSGSYVSVTSGAASSALSLSNIGTNPIDVKVTAQDGTIKTYTITVTRLSANADLSSLALSLGTLSPTFAAATTSYTASVANGITSITVTPTSLSLVATTDVRVNGGSYATVVRATASNALSLNVGSNTVNVRVTSQDGLVTKTYTITVTRAINTWIGGTSSDFNDPLNWSANTVPTIINDFVVASSSNNPQITGNISVNNFTINAGTNLTVTGTLKVAGSITNNGTLTATSGTVEFNGTSAQTIPANTFSGNTVNNLTINNSAGVTLAGALNITGVLTPTAGTLTTGGNLTLVSTALTGGGAIGQGSNSGGYISGTVNVQRYTQAQRGYRTLAHPYTTSQAISLLTNKIRVTGLVANNGTYGVAGGSAQIFNYNPTGTAGNAATVLVPITNATDATKWAVGKALYVFVRGNGEEGKLGSGAANYGSSISPVILDVSGGNINQGNITVPLGYGDATTDNYNLIGNPYPCPINLKNVTGINSYGTVYVYNPTKSNGVLDAYNVRGGFESYDNAGNPDIIIPSMGGFFIKATGAGQSLTFHESDKAIGNTPTYAVFGSTKKPSIRLTISTANGDVDDWKLGLNDAATDLESDTYDAPKLSNSVFNFYSLSSNNKPLAIDYRSIATVNTTTIPLGINTSITGNYRINLATILDLPNTQVILHDKLLKTETLLSNIGDNYSFDITEDTATKGENRFEIGLLSTTVLPTTLTDFNAQLQNGNKVAISWLSATEVNLAYYNVQRSKDGTNFSTVGKVTAKGASGYTYNDDLSTIGNLPSTIYYRLQTVDKDASSTYSKIVALPLGNSNKAGLSIFPNPVKATLLAQVTVTKAGPVEIAITDMQGKLLSKQVAQVAAGTTAVSVSTASLAGGSYVLVINGADGKQQQQFVKE